MANDGNTVKKTEKPYRVLSLDGGGMRGLYTASVLQSLTDLFSKNGSDRDIGKGFDLIVGTSTGGILATALVAGVSIRKIMDIYSTKGREIFTNPFPFKGSIKQLIWAVQNRHKTANSNKILLQELQNIFSDKTMERIYRTRQIGLCLTAVNLSGHQPKIFKTPHAHDSEKNISGKSADHTRKLTDICLATAAAPLIFPIAHLSHPENNTITAERFIDGSLWAKSPILVALTEAIACANKENRKIEIVSIGTCSPPAGKAILKKRGEGLLDWRCGFDLVEIAADSQSKASHFIADLLCRQFNRLGKNIKILRLKETPPSMEQIKFLSTDQAGEHTCSLLTQLGKKDGEKIYKEALGKNADHTLKDIFSHLPDLY